MTVQKKKISVITPFYYGNGYMKRLLGSIRNCIQKNLSAADFEILIVNDSPKEMVCIPDGFDDMDIKVIVNDYNMGIQKTRANGVNKATGDWIVFLDQDDEILCDGFCRQITLTEKADVIIGNGLYQFGNDNKKIFYNYREMYYKMQLSRFVKIRNLIPSPGECLIKKSVIPQEWLQSPLQKNGADDWLLWILLLKKNVIIDCNPELVYIHNYTDGSNLSSNLDKMNESAIEMYNFLIEKNYLTRKEKEYLNSAIMFKYLQDTKKLCLRDMLTYRKAVLANILYKINVVILKISSRESKG